ncbi:Stress response protein nst1 [Stygiomarasmius scandens]|uniref:Stress response protein nst1 n=1 Tax=Marasmiellus scandens TaxID=2682957 RepID=A0ABR1ISW1_9AGAR
MALSFNPRESSDAISSSHPATNIHPPHSAGPSGLAPSAMPQNCPSPGPSAFDSTFVRGMAGSPPAPIGPPRPICSRHQALDHRCFLNKRLVDVSPIARPSATLNNSGSSVDGGGSSGSGFPVRRSPSPKRPLGSSVLAADHDNTAGSIGRDAPAPTSPARSLGGERTTSWGAQIPSGPPVGMGMGMGMHGHHPHPPPPGFGRPAPPLANSSSMWGGVMI